MRVVETTGGALHTAFGVRSGITAFVGGGGKTTAMLSMARALSALGSVLVTTSTHIFPPDDMPVLHGSSISDIRSALAGTNLLCVGTPEPDGKLARPALPFSALRTLFDYVLVEADGAKGMPLKAPAAHEPVLPEDTDLVVAVAGLDGIGRSIQEAVFRPALYAALLGTTESHRISPMDVAKVLCGENGQYKAVRAPMRFAVLLNKADDPSRVLLARRVVLALDAARVECAAIASCKETIRC